MVPEFKCCGLTRPSDAAEASRVGARFIGVVLAGGPRHLDVAAARTVLDGGGSWVRRVGVFGALPAREVARSAKDIGLHVVQLHGDADAGFADELRRHFDGAIWGVVRMAGAELPAQSSSLFAAVDAIVLDTFVRGRLGGTGVPLPWRALARPVAAARGLTPLVLAGGLTADNVSEAISALEPDVVDVSSGIELSPGIKDPVRMRAFADAVALHRSAA